MLDHPPKTRPKLLAMSISDLAYDRLVAEAKAAEYIRQESTKARGLTDYIRAVFAAPHQTWRDNRPDYLKVGDLSRLDLTNDQARRAHIPYATGVNNFPMWWEEDNIQYRRQRTFVRDQLPIHQCRTLATTFGITNPRYHTFEFSDNAVVANVLEAWGNQNLKPTQAPAPRGARTRKSLQFAKHDRYYY